MKASRDRILLHHDQTSISTNGKEAEAVEEEEDGEGNGAEIVGGEAESESTQVGKISRGSRENIIRKARCCGWTVLSRIHGRS